MRLRAIVLAGCVVGALLGCLLGCSATSPASARVQGGSAQATSRTIEIKVRVPNDRDRGGTLAVPDLPPDPPIGGAE